MKEKLAGFLLVLLIVCSSFSFLLSNSVVHAQSGEEWPGEDINGDGDINILDSIEYIKEHYLGYDAETAQYEWDFEDPYDITMANFFMQSVLYVEYIRDSNDDKSVFELVDKLLNMPGFGNGLKVKNFDGTDAIIKDVQSFVYFTIKNFLTNAELLTKTFDTVFQTQQVIDLLTKAGLTIDEIGTLKEELIVFLVEEGQMWLVELERQVDWVKLRTIDSAMAEHPLLREVSDVFRVVISIYELINIAAEHIMNIIEIGLSNIMESVKQYEIWQVEVFRLIIELVGKIAMIAGEQVIEPCFIHGLVTVCAALALGGPPGIIAAAVVGVAGVITYFTVKDIVEKAWDWAADETLGLDLAIHKKLSAAPNEVYVPLYQIEIISINTADEDNYIPWGPGYEGEDIYVVVRNTGVRTLNLRVEPEVWSDGWSIDDKVWWDLNNWIEKKNLRPGEYVWTDFCFHVKSGIIKHKFPWPFSSINDEWIPGENPGYIYFNFYHDWLTEWWDIFDIIGGLKYLDGELAVFFNSVDVLITVHGGPHITNGETMTRVIDVKNLKDHAITVTPVIRLRDSLGEIKKYDSQIIINPSGETTIEAQSTISFTIEWTAPEDAPTGDYSVIIDMKDSTGEEYLDNVLYQTIFFLYKLNIIFPTSSTPAKAGDPSNPNPIYMYVTGLPPLDEDPEFSVQIPPPMVAENIQIVDRLPVPAGYTLKVIPPTQAAEGKYDVQVDVEFGPYHSSARQADAIEYTSAPSVEPIEKGLAWLRTRQYADGSWRSSVGVTSLAVLAFLNAGYDETDTTVKKAINYILKNVKSDGSIYNSHPTYETSLAILSLVATRNDTYKTVIENAKNWLVRCQWDEGEGITKDDWRYGGFGYDIGSRPDLSNTQFAVLALDAAGLPKDHPLWVKLQVFLHRCQNVNFSITLNIEGSEYTVQPYNHYGGYDGGFIYQPGRSLAGGQTSYGSMTGAGIWGLLLAGVPKTDPRVIAAINWVKNHYTWDTNPGIGWWRVYYYYLSMSKALTMYGEPLIDGHDWYQELYNKIVGMQIDAGAGQGYWSTNNEDYVPDLTTAYAILSLQTRAVAPPIHRLSYLTFILRSNCYLRIIDPDDNLVGYNYITSSGENNIPTAVYPGPFLGAQYVVIVNPKAGTYRLELFGVSEGPYELTVQGNHGEETTDKFEYTGYIKPAELHGCDVTVTAIVGPIDVYASSPEFEEIIDTIPPSTTLLVGEPKYVDLNNTYVSSFTPFTLVAEDNPGGVGVSSTVYRIYNSTFDTGWLNYTSQFYLTGLDDGTYNIDFYSTDNLGNVEPTNTVTLILDNTSPITNITIAQPKYVTDMIYVTPDTLFTLTAHDGNGSGIHIIAYRIFNSTYDSGWLNYTSPFTLAFLADGTYTIAYNSTDNIRNVEMTHYISVALFSWDYIFEDSFGRQTILKINVKHKFFQLITPDKDYGIRQATYMRKCGITIVIRYCNEEMRLISVAIPKFDFCIAIAWDKQTCTRYFLLDKIGQEN